MRSTQQNSEIQGGNLPFRRSHPPTVMAASSSSSSSFPLKISLSPPATTFKNFCPCLLRLSSPIQTSKSPGLLLSLEIGRHTSFFPAGVGDTNAATIESAEEDISVNRVPNPKIKNSVGKENNEESVSMNVASEGLDEHKMVRICDKLIGVFMVDKPTPTDWRKLLIFSKEWSTIRPYFYKQCQDRADRENNPEMKHKLLRLARKLREIDEDVIRHNELLDEIRKSSDAGDIVARRRKDFTKEFFLHLHAVSESFYDNPAEREAVVKIADRCLGAVQAYDNATDSLEALTAAETKFEDIINSPTLDAACRKIDNLAEKNQLDSTLVLMITKAWSAAKESNMMKDEVKDILYHLYKTARGNLQRLVPKEIRILKYLLTIEDPEERMSALNDAFIPGVELEGDDVDSLYTTPEQLHTWIRGVVDAYHSSGKGTLISEAKDLMNPKIVPRMEELMKTIQDNFM